MNGIPKVSRCLHHSIRRISPHGLNVSTMKRKGGARSYEADSTTILSCPRSTSDKSTRISSSGNISHADTSTWKTMMKALSASQRGEFHLFINEEGRNKKTISRVQVLTKQFVSLNRADAVDKVILTEKANGRHCPFFQKYVFEHRGFSFEHMSERCLRQKQILKDYLNQTMVDDSFHEDVEKLKVSLDRDKDTDVDNNLRQCLGDMFSRMCLGESTSPNDVDKGTVWKFADVLYTLLGMDAVLGAFPILRHLPGKYRSAFKDAIKHRDKLKHKYFDSQKDTFRDGHHRGLVDVCLQIQSTDRKCDTHSQLTDEHIQGIIFDSLLAGLTEMQKSLRMLVLLMCHFKNVQTRVQSEIDEMLPSGVLPTLESRQNMPYTQAVILEMLRYSSQTPLAIPHVSSEDISVDGHVINKNTLIFPNLFGIHHDETTWGDPWNFRPERFLDDAGQLIPETHKSRLSLIPFVVGTRKCPGESFAMFRLYVIFTSLLRDVTFSPPCDEELPPVDPRLYTNKYPMYLPHFKCRVTDR